MKTIKSTTDDAVDLAVGHRLDDVLRILEQQGHVRPCAHPAWHPGGGISVVLREMGDRWNWGGGVWK
jgi:hypothetical protein